MTVWINHSMHYWLAILRGSQSEGPSVDHLQAFAPDISQTALVIRDDVRRSCECAVEPMSTVFICTLLDRLEM